MPYTKDGGWTGQSKDGPPQGAGHVSFFRDLTPEEVLEFQEYAVENPPPDDVSFCHPVCRDIWGSKVTPITEPGEIVGMMYPGEQDPWD